MKKGIIKTEVMAPYLNQNPRLDLIQRKRKNYTDLLIIILIDPIAIIP